MTYKDAILRCARKEPAFYTDRSGNNHEVMINSISQQRDASITLVNETPKRVMLVQVEELEYI